MKFHTDTMNLCEENIVVIQKLGKPKNAWFPQERVHFWTQKRQPKNGSPCGPLFIIISQVYPNDPGVDLQKDVA
jgi:hypothetical protein